MSILLLSLKQRLQQAFPQLEESDFSHHASDLYVVAYSFVGEWLRANYEWYRSITVFVDAVNGQQTYDIPFAYDEERDGECTAPLCGHQNT